MSEEEKNGEEEEDEESFDLDKILEKWQTEKGWISKAEVDKLLEGYEPKRTRAKKKKKPEEKKPEEESPKCSRCGGELKQTEQGWWKCQKCGRGYILK